jgi:hypothetical protein
MYLTVFGQVPVHTVDSATVVQLTDNIRNAV